MPVGILVVAKALLTRDLNYDLLSYAARNAVFPHDSTGDQFFDDEKFCAYSQLGREIGSKARVAMAEEKSRRAEENGGTGKHEERPEREYPTLVVKVEPSQPFAQPSVATAGWLCQRGESRSRR